MDAAVASNGVAHWLLRADAALRLGPRPVALMLWHRAALAAGLPRRALEGALAPAGRFLPGGAPPAPPLPRGDSERILAAAAALPPRPDWHGPFPADAPALGMDLFGPGDIRPVWEASRFADLLLLAQAARLDAAFLPQAEARVAAWCAANPPFLGPAWACGQEAALRALSLALALALLDAPPPPGARALLALCAQRIAATPAYAAAQDNNHSLSEPAGAYACALLLDDPSGAARAARRLARAVARLIAWDGGFAQVSAGYARLALDVLSVAEILRRRHGAPAFPAPFTDRAAALAAWLHGLVAPEDGSTPALGVEDGSAFADLGLNGPRDARGSVERAARLFANQGADLPAEPGCTWLGLPVPSARLARPARWRAEGTMGWAEAGASAVLRSGPVRFRPSQSDLLHLTLRDGPRAVLRDGGTGAYNPPAPWWWAALADAAAHNAVVFDGEAPMPRLGRFLFARWPRLTALPDGAALRDAAGRVQRRRVSVEGRVWTVTDELSGRFETACLHWRLPPGDWCLEGRSAVADGIRIEVEAREVETREVETREVETREVETREVETLGGLRLRMQQGWESPKYGQISPIPVMVVEVTAPVAGIRTKICLPDHQELIST